MTGGWYVKNLLKNAINNLINSIIQFDQPAIFVCGRVFPVGEAVFFICEGLLSSHYINIFVHINNRS